MNRLPLPNSEIEVQISWDALQEDRPLEIVYRGSVEALVAAAAATNELLARAKPGKTRRDADGDRALVQYRKGWLELRLRKSLKHGRRLPGVTDESISAAQEEFRRIWKIYYPGRAYPEPAESPPARRPSYIRLVVDNARR
jgi:hypothetical protein